MLTAAFLSLALDVGCPVPAQQVAISAEALSGETLGGQAQPDAAARYRVGDFIYEGHGIAMSSPDPRFRDLVLDQQFGLRHRCGNTVLAPSGWNADDKDRTGWSLRIEQLPVPSEPMPGSLAAERRGARPILAGHVAGATWPFYLGNGTFFLGLMHPEDESAETLIVAFGDDPHPTPALIMARIPMTLETLSIVPELHGPGTFVNLEALHEGKLTQVVLVLARETALATYARLTSAHPAGE
jgi:hypothetical protein